MTEINFTSQPASCEEANLIHTNIKIGIDHNEITGYCLQNIEPGDVLKVPSSQEGHTLFKVINVSKRDHKGIFINPDNKINSFFSATCKPF